MGIEESQLSDLKEYIYKEEIETKDILVIDLRNAYSCNITKMNDNMQNGNR